MTSHLESTKDFRDQRKRQLKQCFEAVKAEPASQNVIFGGDLNLRDKEVFFKSFRPLRLFSITCNSVGKHEAEG